MADQIYKVRDPTGAIREIKGPEGATDDQVLAQAKTLFGASSEPSPPPPPVAPRMVGALGDLPTNAPPGQNFFDQQPERNMAQEIAGSPVTRFALGAASPFLAAGQMLDKGMKAALPERAYQVLRPELGRAQERIEPMVQEGRAARGSEGVDFANLAGSVMSPAALTAMKLPMAATGAGRIAQGGGIGGLMGLGTPAGGPGDDFASQKAQQVGTGMALGAAIPAAAEGVRGAYRTGRNVLQPWLPGQKGVDLAVGRTLNKAAGDDRESVIAALGRPELVPGSRPGAGEAAANVGRTEFSALQEAVRGRNPTPYDRMGRAQNEARQAHIGTFAGDRQKLADALKARGEAADEAYGAVRGNRINLKSDADIMAEAIAEREAARVSALQDTGRFQTMAAQQGNLAQGGTVRLSPGQKLNEPQMNVGATGGEARSPSAYPPAGQPRVPERYTENRARVSDALSGADDAANVVAQRARERDFLTTQADILKQTVGLSDESISSLLSRPSMVDALKDAAKSASEGGHYFPTKPGEKLTVGNLQRIKESLDSGIKAAQNKEPSGLRQDLSSKELLDTRNLFVKLLSEKSPGWKDARQDFAQASRGTNQMEVGQELQKRLTDSSGKETVAKFLGSVDERTDDAVTKLVKHSVTGKPRYTTLDQALEPKNATATRDVVADALRSVRHKENTVAGAERAREIVGQIAPKVPAAGMFSPHYSVTRAVLNRISGLAEGKSLDRLNEVMRDPKMTAKLMEAATPSEQAMIRNEWAGKGGRFATIAASLGAAQGQ